jgi:serine protease Do
MITRLIVSTALITTSIVFPVHQAQAATAILPKQVSVIAKSTVVRIESSYTSNGVATPGLGSGVIVGRVSTGQTDTYTVLTAAHVFQNLDATYEIITPLPATSSNNKTRQRIKIDPKVNVKKINGVDLALVTFKSNLVFKYVTIGDSDYADEGVPIYVAGFPMPGAAILKPVYQFTGSMISSRLDKTGESDEKPVDNLGYNMVYTSVTWPGMSGGPVFDVAGRLIGIHGQGDRQVSKSSENSQSGTRIVGEKTGFNLGIPIRILLQKVPEIRKQSGAKYDMTVLKYQVDNNGPVVVTRSKKFKARVRRNVRADVQEIDVTEYKETGNEED